MLTASRGLMPKSTSPTRRACESIGNGADATIPPTGASVAAAEAAAST